MRGGSGEDDDGVGGMQRGDGHPPLRYAFPSGRAARPGTWVPGPISDMDALKKRMAQARSGTGEVRVILSSVTFQPRAAAFTSLIQAASKSKNAEKALEIFHTMQEMFGIPPNTFSSSALIAALAKAGRWQLAEHYFNDLLVRSKSDPRCLPNTITFSALLNAYEKGGQFSRALSVFNQQLEAMVDPDIITFSSLIAACERAGACRTGPRPRMEGCKCRE